MTKFYSFFSNIFLISIAIITFSCSGDEGTNDPGNEIDISFESRNYELYVPATYNSSAPSPLLIVFHGATQTGKIAQSYGGFDEMGIDQRFIIAYPDAFEGRWADGCFCNEAEYQGVNDVLFTDYLIDEIKSQYNIDDTRIYAVGISQGGIFVQNLACKRSDKFAAFGSIIGSMRSIVSRTCEPISPINLVMVNSTNDRDVVWDGFSHPQDGIISIPEIMQKWAGFADCSGEYETEQLPDRGFPSFSVEKRIYKDCSSGKDLVLYAVVDGIHTWYRTQEIDASKVVMDFFKEH